MDNSVFHIKFVGGVSVRAIINVIGQPQIANLNTRTKTMQNVIER